MFQCKASFPKPNAPEIYPGGTSSLSSLMLNTVWLYMNIPQIVYSVDGTLGLFPVFSYYEEICYEHSYMFFF